MMRLADWWNGTRDMHGQTMDIPTRIVPIWKRGLALPQSADYARIADEGYRKNSIVYACIRTIATSGSEPTLEAIRVRRSEEPEVLPAESPLTKLLYWPNPEMDSCELLEIMLTHYSIAGEWYLLKRRSGAGRLVELWPLRPDRMAPVTDSDGSIQRYEYSIGGGSKKTIDADDIVVMRNPDPLDDYRGLSPIIVAARMGDIDNQAADYIRAFFTNGGVPAGWLKLKGIVEAPERQRIRQKFQDQFTGEHGWHTLGVLDQDADWAPAGFEPSKLDLAGIFSVSETRICMTFGVPPIIIAAQTGLARATYANYREAQRSLWKTTLSPLYERLAGKLSHSIAKEFGDDLEVRFDLDSVEGMQESMTDRWTRALDGWQRGLITRNEGRQLVGMPRVIDGDVIKQDQLALEMPAIAEESSIVRHIDTERLMNLAERLSAELALTERERTDLVTHAGNGNGVVRA
jgi:HK97 family phage portal protein